MGKKIKITIPDTAQELLDMTEPVETYADPFLGLKTNDRLPGYAGAAGVIAAIVTVLSQTHEASVQIAGIASLAVVVACVSALNGFVVRERHRTLRVENVNHTVPDGEPDDVA